MAGEVKVDTRELEAAFAAVERSVKDLSAADHAVAESLLPAIAQRTPTRTGRLAAGWTVGDGGSIDNEEDYAGVIEYGDARRGIEAAHMAADALAASERELGVAYEEELAKVMRRAGFDVK